jgi:Undecaprenyl-phosphate glucose phosphotransferase
MPYPDVGVFGGAVADSTHYRPLTVPRMIIEVGPVGRINGVGMDVVRPETLSRTTAASAIDKGTVAQRPIPWMLISEPLRLYDCVVIGWSGLSLHYLYVMRPGQEVDDRYVGLIALGTILSAIICQQLRLYSVDTVFTRWLGLKRALTAWAIAFGALLAIAFAFKVANYYSRVWVVSWFGVAAALMILGRLLVSRITLVWAHDGRLANRSLIVGTGEQAQRLASVLHDRHDPRTHIIGFVDDESPGDAVPGRPIGGPVLGNVDHMIGMIRRNLVDEVIIALPWSAEERVRDLTLKLATTPVRIRLAPDLVGFQFADRSFARRSGLPLLKILDRPIAGWSYVAKWLEDQLVAVILLILMAPVMLTVALAIKLDSPGPVLFRQRRFGFNDELIEVWKFRTMRADCADARADAQTTRNDPRVTRVGHLLRKYSIDELPQLFNVLRGEMSIVGPRPHAVATKADGRLLWEVVSGYAARHRVKPGITGWAQVNGWRGETNTIEKIHKRVEHDLYYIDNWSVWFDLSIILRTGIALVRAENAY